MKISPQDTRFGLMGNHGGEKGLRKLSKEEKIVSLKTAWETPEKTFFQFQVLVNKQTNTKQTKTNITKTKNQKPKPKTKTNKQTNKQTA